MSSNKLAENAIKLNEKLSQLRETLRPAIEEINRKLGNWSIECPYCGNEDVWTHNSSKNEYPNWYSCDVCDSDSRSLTDEHEALLEAGRILGVE